MDIWCMLKLPLTNVSSSYNNREKYTFFDEPENIIRNYYIPHNPHHMRLSLGLYHIFLITFGLD